MAHVVLPSKQILRFKLMAIRFGTSGWRAIIADDFTFENVRLVTEAVCSYLTTNEVADGKTLIVGHDSRFMGEKFASVAAEIAAIKGFSVLVCTGLTPTPFVVHAVDGAGLVEAGP